LAVGVGEAAGPLVQPLTIAATTISATIMPK
jgi:hypothetical protein